MTLWKSLQRYGASLVAQRLKASACNAGDLGSIPGSRRSPESHGWRSLVGYSPWGHKESDMAEPLNFYRDMNILRARNQCHLSQFL